METTAPDLSTYVRKPLAPSHVARLREVGEVVTFAPGETIVAFGRPSNDFFYILEGQAAAFDEVTGERYGSATLGPTQFTGEISLLTGGTAMLTNRAVTDLRALRVDRQVLLQLMSSIPEMSDIIVTVLAARRRRLIESDQAGLTLIGANQDRAVRRVEAFAASNFIPFRSLSHDSAEASSLAQRCGISPGGPAVVLGEGRVLADPTPRMIAKHFGLDLAVEEGAEFDVVIVGAGPAGIAAGVYAGAEGLKALVIDELSIGGQAATSSRIENYMGFPTGISGADLCARGEIQALKFGTRFAVPRKVCSISARDGGFSLELDDGVEVSARSVIVATGVQYRKLPIDGLDKFEGAGVSYAATEIEARYLGGGEAVVVGAGNSAGQAAMFLSQKASRVHLVVRGQSLTASMSAYLTERVVANKGIEVHLQTEVTALYGDLSLQRVDLTDHLTGASRNVAATGLFLMVGAAPNTSWLTGFVEMDAKGFVLAGPEFTTSRKGIFVVGDVRASSVKRVASAVGEGSIVISKVWNYLRQAA
jgi:thioredoxin reductase (NADPH)